MHIDDGKMGIINYVIGGKENFEELRLELFDICKSIALKYNLYRHDGKERFAAIISILAQESCPSCAVRKLTSKGGKKIDSFYGECHAIATNILVEELFDIFTKMGLVVSITPESDLELGRVDIQIEVSRTGISIKDREATRLVIEIKTGNSFSLHQILRYLFDGKAEKVLAWRIRNRQVLVFDYEETLPLMRKFARLICLRGTRLLAYGGGPDDCEHPSESEYFPTDDALEAMFKDFTKSIDATLPAIVTAVFENLIPPKGALSAN